LVNSTIESTDEIAEGDGAVAGVYTAPQLFAEDWLTNADLAALSGVKLRTVNNAASSSRTASWSGSTPSRPPSSGSRRRRNGRRSSCGGLPKSGGCA